MNKETRNQVKQQASRIKDLLATVQRNITRSRGTGCTTSLATVPNATIVYPDKCSAEEAKRKGATVALMHQDMLGQRKLILFDNFTVQTIADKAWHSIQNLQNELHDAEHEATTAYSKGFSDAAWRDEEKVKVDLVNKDMYRFMRCTMGVIDFFEHCSFWQRLKWLFTGINGGVIALLHQEYDNINKRLKP